MKTNPSLVDRFFHVLVQEIRSRVPSYLKSSFTVAEIYQTLVPYRTHRDRIGAEMNGDYEDALLRLLAGEGDYLTLESDAARQRLEREAGLPHPNTGLYREYAAVGVRLNPGKIPEPSSSPGSDHDQEQRGLEQGALVSDEELDALVGRALDSADEELRLDALLGQALGTDAGSSRRKDDVPPTRSPAPEAEDQSRRDTADGPETASPKRHQEPPASQVEFPAAPASPEVRPTPARAEQRRTDASPSHNPRRSGPETSSPSGGAVRESATVKPVPAEQKTPVVRHRVMEIPHGVNLGAPPEACPECDAELPERENLRFCPFCGTNVFLLPCRSCGEVLERGWNYCLACGTAVE